MKIESKDIFAVEIGKDHYHFNCIPVSGDPLTKDDIILRGDEDQEEVCFCDECGELII